MEAPIDTTSHSTLKERIGALLVAIRTAQSDTTYAKFIADYGVQHGNVIPTLLSWCTTIIPECEQWLGVVPTLQEVLGSLETSANAVNVTGLRSAIDSVKTVVDRVDAEVDEISTNAELTKSLNDSAKVVVESINSSLSVMNGKIDALDLSAINCDLTFSNDQIKQATKAMVDKTLIMSTEAATVVTKYGKAQENIESCVESLLANAKMLVDASALMTNSVGTAANSMNLKLQTVSDQVTNDFDAFGVRIDDVKASLSTFSKNVADMRGDFGTEGAAILAMFTADAGKAMASVSTLITEHQAIMRNASSGIANIADGAATAYKAMCNDMASASDELLSFTKSGLTVSNDTRQIITAAGAVREQIQVLVEDLENTKSLMNAQYDIVKENVAAITTNSLNLVDNNKTLVQLNAATAALVTNFTQLYERFTSSKNIELAIQATSALGTLLGGVGDLATGVKPAPQGRTLQ